MLEGSGTSSGPACETGILMSSTQNVTFNSWNRHYDTELFNAERNIQPIHPHASSI